MPPPPPPAAAATLAPELLALDVASALLTLGLVAFFVRSWTRTRDDFHLLFAVGYLFLAVGFLVVSTGAFGRGAGASLADVTRMVLLLGGSLVLAFAYVSAGRHGAARAVEALAWTVAVLAGVLVAALAALPALPGGLPLDPVEPAFLAVMTAAFAACAHLASRGTPRRPGLDRVLVPAAFGAWGLSKYTWLLVDLSDAVGLVPVVYLWRFAALGLFVAALGLPPAAPRTPAPAPADAGEAGPDADPEVRDAPP